MNNRFDSGTLYVCDLTDTRVNGNAPKEELTKRNKYWFERRTIGISRQYMAKGVNERIDLLVRVQGIQNISIGQYVILGNGDQYRIDNVSTGNTINEYTRIVKKDFINGYKTAQIVGLDYTELTLSKLENYYDVAITEN